MKVFLLIQAEHNESWTVGAYTSLEAAKRGMDFVAPISDGWKERPYKGLEVLREKDMDSWIIESHEVIE